jgi:hypothetical protein
MIVTVLFFGAGAGVVGGVPNVPLYRAFSAAAELEEPGEAADAAPDVVPEDDAVPEEELHAASPTSKGTSANPSARRRVKPIRTCSFVVGNPITFACLSDRCKLRLSVRQMQA